MKKVTKKVESELLIKKYKETYTYIYKGIIIHVKIDYVNNRISLVEPFKSGIGKFQQKTWIFTERGVEYMEGWLTILDAMKEAIKDAKYRLEMYKEQVEKEMEKRIKEGLKEIQDEWIKIKK